MNLVQIVDQCDSDSRLWFPKIYAFSELETLAYHTMAMNGEAGELANKVKKVWRNEGRMLSLADLDPDVRHDLAEENMDTFIYCMNVFATLGVGDPEILYNHKRHVNLARFGGQRGD